MERKAPKRLKAGWPMIMFRGVHGLGQPIKPGQTHPKNSKKMGWVG